jgi:hypothetical protein
VIEKTLNTQVRQRQAILDHMKDHLRNECYFFEALICLLLRHQINVITWKVNQWHYGDDDIRSKLIPPSHDAALQLVGLVSEDKMQYFLDQLIKLFVLSANIGIAQSTGEISTFEIAHEMFLNYYYVNSKVKRAINYEAPRKENMH